MIGSLPTGVSRRMSALGTAPVENIEFELVHGIGGRADLPIPGWMAQYGAVAVLLITFAVLMKSSRARATFQHDKGNARRAPLSMSIVDNRWPRAAMRTIGVVMFTSTVAIGLLGPASSAENVVPTWFYVWLWVGIIPASLLFGRVWRSIDPLPVFSAAASKIIRVSRRRYPSRIGRWPAALGLGAFVWMELVLPERDDPRKVAVFVIAYALVHVTGGVLYGSEWHERADAFGNYSDCVARLSPWQRDEAHRLTIVNPIRNLKSLPVDSGMLAVVTVLLGATAFDGLTRSSVWTDWTESLSGGATVLVGTLGLFSTIAIVAMLFRLSLTVNAHATKDGIEVSDLPVRLAPSLVPVAVGYIVAHYFSLLVFQGQLGYLLLSDPFGKGWDLFGTGDRRVDYLVVSSMVIATVQVIVILLGHLIGVVVAHDRAVAVFRTDEHPSVHYPLMLAMMIYTYAGIGLLLGP